MVPNQLSPDFDGYRWHHRTCRVLLGASRCASRSSPSPRFSRWCMGCDQICPDFVRLSLSHYRAVLGWGTCLPTNMVCGIYDAMLRDHLWFTFTIQGKTSSYLPRQCDQQLHDNVLAVAATAVWIDWKCRQLLVFYGRWHSTVFALDHCSQSWCST